VRVVRYPHVCCTQWCYVGITALSQSWRHDSARSAGWLSLPTDVLPPLATKAG